MCFAATIILYREFFDNSSAVVSPATPALDIPDEYETNASDTNDLPDHDDIPLCHGYLPAQITIRNDEGLPA